MLKVKLRQQSKYKNLPGSQQPSTINGQRSTFNLQH